MSPGPPLERILFIDDDPYIGKLAALSLRSLGGYVVETLLDPLDAVPRALDFRPDLVLLDLVMPGRDGLETRAALRAEPRTAALPLVFLTGKAGELELPDDPAVLGVIAKPFDPAGLPARLAELWQGRP